MDANDVKNARRVKQLQRLLFGKQSMSMAAAGCNLALKSNPSEYERCILASGIATVYASPFTSANELGPLEDDFSRFAYPKLAATHREIMVFRNQLYGHRDLSVTGTNQHGRVGKLHFIDVEITGHGTATTTSSLVQWPDEAFTKTKALCSFQEDRLQKKANKLMKQLAHFAKKPLGKYRLGVDFP
ncbi:MAG TPA: hypothetical protein VGZ93_00060 [Candidatus Methylacidiphilales bacterium]|nr:hypothetical protein [Candidatus Methylacidiphilales bacterium]